MAGHGNCEAHGEVLVLSHRWFCVREARDADAAFVEGVGGCGRDGDAPRFFERWPTVVAASRVFRIRGGLQDGPKIRSVPRYASA